MERVGRLQAVLGSSEVAQQFAREINSLHDASWEFVRKQLPTAGLVSASRVRTDCSDVERAFLPRFQSLVPTISLDPGDMNLLLSCTARAAANSLTVSAPFSGKELAALRRIAAILRAAGALSIEALWADESGIFSEPW